MTEEDAALVVLWAASLDRQGLFVVLPPTMCNEVLRLTGRSELPRGIVRNDPIRVGERS